MGPTSYLFRLRYIILALAVTSTCVDYLSRSNITMAIIAMVRYDDISNHTTEYHHANNSNPDDGHFTCPLPTTYNQSTGESTTHVSKPLPGPKYDWNPKMQGIILGAFFYSFVVVQVPAGRMAEVFGGKWIVATGLLGATVVNLLTPLIAHSYVGIIVSRIVLGFLQGGIFPACYSIVYNWLPQSERALGFALMDVGTNIGTIIATTMSGYLSEYGFADGWPSTFYVSGLIALTHLTIWSLFVTSHPRDHKMIGKEELSILDYTAANARSSSSDVSSPPSTINIISNVKDTRDVEDDVPTPLTGSTASSDIKIRVPWMALFTSPPVLALLFFRFSFFWTFLMIMNKLPTYMNDILHVSPTENGLLNALLYVANSVSLVTGGYISERVIEKGILSRTNTRKLFALSAGLGLATCLAFVPVVGCAPRTVTMLLVLGLFFQGFSSGGDIPIPAEMTSNFPTTIYALANMCSMCPGFIAPYVVGLILEMDGDIRVLWSIVFYGSAAISAAGALLFLKFASASIQDWDSAHDMNRITRI